MFDVPLFVLFGNQYTLRTDGRHQGIFASFDKIFQIRYAGPACKTFFAFFISFLYKIFPSAHLISTIGLIIHGSPSVLKCEYA